MIRVLARRVGERGFEFGANLLYSCLRFNRIGRLQLRNEFLENGSLIDYGTATDVTVPEPDAYNRYIPEVDRMMGTHRIPQPFVGTIENARLVGAPPLAVSGYRYIEDASVSPNVQFLNMVNSLTSAPDRIRSGSVEGEPLEEAVLLHNSWVGGYFHWVAETLTRLEGVERYIEETGNRPKLVVGPDLNSFQRRSLELLGYRDDDLVNWDSLYCTVDRLVVPSMRRAIDPGKPSPFPHAWLRDTLRERALNNVDTSRFSSRVYISRQDAKSRRVVNEDEVLTALEEYGFESYLLTEMDVEEVIALFAQADCIVTPHGAALTDVIYTDDAAVVELMRDDRHDGVYYMTTKQVGGWYGYLECESVDFDLSVEIDELRKIVDAAIRRDSPGAI